MLRNASAGVIRVSGRNPHYYEYKGKEILLITSAEHYGAVVSKNFDYVPYFNMLAEYGLNYTRIYPGAIVEPAGYWMSEDTLTPGEDFIAPWARSDVPGYAGGGNKFDLNRWDPEYFSRLRDFLTEAEKRDIIVEICFFNCMQEKYWAHSPLCETANIQGVGTCDNVAFQTLDNGALVREQLRYIEKIIVETNDFDNIIYEFVDEPTTVLTPSNKAYHWIEKMIETAIDTENRLPKKHLLAQQLELGVNFSDDDRVAVIVTQYIGLSWRQVGGVPALDNCYCHNKPIELNETAYVGAWITEADDLASISRLEAWEFMVGGGAGFNQLNGYFKVSNPSGESEANRALLTGLQNLRTFLEGFDFARMRRDTETVKRASIGASINMISDPGRRYAIYMHHSFPVLSGKSRYDPRRGAYSPEIALSLPKGAYRAEFIEPATLKVLRKTGIESAGEDIILACPSYSLDLAIKIYPEEI